MRIQRVGQKILTIGNHGLQVISPRGGAAGPVILDTFTDTNGTAIGDHIPDIAPVGSVWTNLLNTVQVYNNRFESVVITQDCAAVIDTGISDFTIEAQVCVYTQASVYNRLAKIFFRHNVTNGTNYTLACNAYQNTLYLAKNGSVIASTRISALGLSNGDLVTLKVVASGTSLKGYINDGYEVSTTQSDYSTDTYAGIGVFRNSSHVMYADNFQVNNVI